MALLNRFYLANGMAYAIGCRRHEAEHSTRVALYWHLLDRHPAETVRRYLPRIARILAQAKESEI